MQRPERCFTSLRIVCLPGILSRLIRHQRHDGIHFRIHSIDLFQVRVHNFARAQFFAPDQRGHFDRRKKANVRRFRSEQRRGRGSPQNLAGLAARDGLISHAGF